MEEKMITNPSPVQFEKYEKLKTYLKSLGKTAVAFSSGVDSTFLLYAAKEALGEDVIAVTAASGLFPERERTEAENYCRLLGVRHFILRVDELKIDGFAENPKNRCYICKHHLFSGIMALAADNGMDFVAEGSNMDDMGDYRPGMQAIAELGIKSPLREAEMTKEDIRILSRYFGVPTWGKPSFACLASRFVYGERITREKLRMVDQAESLLLKMGFRQFRVRIHGLMARIELLPEEFPILLEEKNRKTVYEAFRSYGFTYISMDLAGYRTGAMNETLGKG